MEKRIYVDNAATTKVAPEVLEAMLPYFTENYGNPSSIYQEGRTAKTAIEKAREQVATAIGAQPKEIYFTGSGSDADNWAIRSVAKSLKNKGNHIITTAVEHHAVLHTCKDLEKQGFEVTLLDVHEDGVVRVEDVAAAIRDDTALVSVMFANNEIGTLQPIEAIGALCRERGIPFHTDAVQAIGHVPVNVQEMNIDMLSCSAHKFHGPRGVGFLYARRGIPLTNIIEGGAQERGKRGGTENTPAIAGMTAALREAVDHMDENMRKVTRLRETLITGLETIAHARLNGERTQRVPGTVNFCFEGIEGESLLLLLDRKGIAASSGSACTSGSLDPSHVLLALGLPHEVAHGSLRLSVGEYNTDEEMAYIVENVRQVVDYLRSISPVWDELETGVRPHQI